MITVWLATFPAMFYGMYNVGFQANTILASSETIYNTDWHESIILMFAGHDPSSIWDCMIYGAVYFIPIYMVTLIATILIGYIKIKERKGKIKNIDNGGITIQTSVV